jgi:signal transduction histidine kinase
VTVDSALVSEQLLRWSRNGQLVPGAITLRSVNGDIKCRAEGARLSQPIGEVSNLILLRLTPGIRASAAFVELNERLNHLHAEVAERRNIQGALEQSEQELRHARERLEERVHGRTRELVEVTSQLKHEVEQRRLAEDRLRQLSGRLLSLRDDERRRLARELHDSIGQLLAALQLNIALLQANAKPLPADAAKRLEECNALADQAIREVRTISYLLHPPMLDEAGLALALQWYVDGFVKRSRIDIALHVSKHMERLPQEVETAVFRIAQEALTNIHRHSGSTKGEVRLTVEGDCLTLVVRDEGKGIPADKLEDGQTKGGHIGVGLRGMRERVKHLGGEIRVAAANPGTIVAVTIPLAAARKHSSARGLAS